MHINNQSDEIRRLSERNEYLEGINKSLALAEHAAYKVAKEYQAELDGAHRLIVWMFVACGTLASLLALAMWWILA
jgi:hypothetical protein